MTCFTLGFVTFNGLEDIRISFQFRSSAIFSVQPIRREFDLPPSSVQSYKLLSLFNEENELFGKPNNVGDLPELDHKVIIFQQLLVL